MVYFIETSIGYLQFYSWSRRRRPSENELI